MASAVKVEVNCNACRGSGLRVSLSQLGVHVVCFECKGTGKQTLVYTPFDGRQVVPGVTRVSSSDYEPLRTIVSYQEFLAGNVPQDKT